MKVMDGIKTSWCNINWFDIAGMFNHKRFNHEKQVPIYKSYCLSGMNHPWLGLTNILTVRMQPECSYLPLGE